MALPLIQLPPLSPPFASTHPLCPSPSFSTPLPPLPWLAQSLRRLCWELQKAINDRRCDEQRLLLTPLPAASTPTSPSSFCWIVALAFIRLILCVWARKMLRPLETTTLHYRNRYIKQRAGQTDRQRDSRQTLLAVSVWVSECVCVCVGQCDCVSVCFYAFCGTLCGWQLDERRRRRRAVAAFQALPLPLPLLCLCLCCAWH